jgi:hypothetical protein
LVHKPAEFFKGLQPDAGWANHQSTRGPFFMDSNSIYEADGRHKDRKTWDYRETVSGHQVLVRVGDQAGLNEEDRERARQEGRKWLEALISDGGQPPKAVLVRREIPPAPRIPYLVVEECSTDDDR